MGVMYREAEGFGSCLIKQSFFFGFFRKVERLRSLLPNQKEPIAVDDLDEEVQDAPPPPVPEIMVVPREQAVPIHTPQRRLTGEQSQQPEVQHTASPPVLDNRLIVINTPQRSLTGEQSQQPEVQHTASPPVLDNLIVIHTPQRSLTGEQSQQPEVQDTASPPVFDNRLIVINTLQRSLTEEQSQQPEVQDTASPPVLDNRLVVINTPQRPSSRKRSRHPGDTGRGAPVSVSWFIQGQHGATVLKSTTLDPPQQILKEVLTVCHPNTVILLETDSNGICKTIVPANNVKTIERCVAAKKPIVLADQNGIPTASRYVEGGYVGGTAEKRRKLANGSIDTMGGIKYAAIDWYTLQSIQEVEDKAIKGGYMTIQDRARKGASSEEEY